MLQNILKCQKKVINLNLILNIMSVKMIKNINQHTILKMLKKLLRKLQVQRLKLMIQQMMIRKIKVINIYQILHQELKRLFMNNKFLIILMNKDKMHLKYNCKLNLIKFLMKLMLTLVVLFPLKNFKELLKCLLKIHKHKLIKLRFNNLCKQLMLIKMGLSADKNFLNFLCQSQVEHDTLMIINYI